jgi:phosphatidylserine decarboxylase precursor-related protein
MQFFRHPGCTTPLEPDLVVAPAAGRVVHIGLEEEPEVLRDRRLRISIFLSIFDAHLTRSPVSGRITYQRYHPGRYFVALHPKSSTLNERNSILVEHPSSDSSGLDRASIYSYHPPAQSWYSLASLFGPAKRQLPACLPSDDSRPGRGQESVDEL